MVFPVNVCKDQNTSEIHDTQGEGSRKEIIQKVRGILKELENSGHSECRCTNLKSPPEGMKVVATGCLDGKEGIKMLIPTNKSHYTWIPPPVDNRPALDPSHYCFAPTIAKQFYNCDIGKSSAKPHHQPSANDTPSARPKGDYCEDPTFVAPEPLQHQQWTNEPGGSCRHPQYCKAHCFEHTPHRDWARH